MTVPLKTSMAIDDRTTRDVHCGGFKDVSSGGSPSYKGLQWQWMTRPLRTFTAPSDEATGNVNGSR